MTLLSSCADVSYNGDRCISKPLLLTKYFAEESPTKPDISGLAITTKDPHEKLQLSYSLGNGIPTVLGRGGYCMVFKAEDLKSGQLVALKKSRTPLRVKRPFLQHESRVLQLLQGHPAIPKLYGYGHLKHFEYLSMEILGSSVSDKTTEALTVITVIRIVEQTLCALKHVHKHGLVHRDIKPGNLICSMNDPSKIMLIDFNIAKPISSGPPTTNDPINKIKHTAGTPEWASLNSHRRIDFGPGDDLESLAYTALSLLRGNLPWFNDDIYESFLQSEIRIHKVKAAMSASQLVMHFPTDFAYFLDYSRGLDYHEMPDYNALEDRLRCLAESLGGYSKDDPLDWTSVPSVKIEPQIEQSSLNGTDDDVNYGKDNGDSDSERHTNSYFGDDIDCWDDVHSCRDADITLPTEVEELADSQVQVPTIIEVYGY
ncbi:hypothetical protein Clacol_000679 [Clathrus columnatus]|uniref:non-specific serine/threonine protein kinase n=1 Tax=Clathrus columnatus TaxID=1419009 RepID=A0AAV4ZZ01_9AGAM|nr:hypothetical protein Clacol_000679 [Clathrus columnatus]